MPVLALCDRNDIGGISIHRHPQIESGAVFIYDGHPGGVGIAARIFQDLPDLLARVLDLLDGCECEDGCPSCIQSPKCGNGNRPLDKAGAARVLRLLLDREEPVEVPEEMAFAPPEGVGAELASAREGTADADLGGETGPPRAENRGRRRDPPLHAPEAGSSSGLVTTVLFDLETRRSAAEVGGWNNAHKMGISLGVALVLEEGRFEVFPEERVEELADLLCSANLVVGFNVKRFDYRVLAGYTGVDYVRKLETLDLLEEVQRAIGIRVKLDDLCRETLGGDGKSGDGLQCLEWVREGKMDLVESYCKKDVELLRDLYLHGRREGYVYFRHKQRGRVKVTVDW